MGYKIRYGKNNKLESNRRKEWYKIVLLVAGTVCWVLVGVVWPETRDMFWRFFFPWLNEPTMAAFSNMIEQIGGGCGVATAFSDFCREVISYAGTPV